MAQAYDPKRGQAYQGDVVVLPLPRDIIVAHGDEIAMRGDMLVLE